MKRIIVLISLIQAMIFVPAHSSNVRVIAEGVFAGYTDPNNLLPFSEPAPGTVFRIEFIYDDTTPDSLIIVPDIALYEDTISDITLTIGSDTFGILETINNITVLDDLVTSGGDYVDFWLAATGTDTPTGTPGQVVSERFSLLLQTMLPSPPVPPLTSDDLVEPSWPSGWDDGVIQYSIFLRATDGSVPPEQLASAYANITSITVIPLPAAVWLFGSAIGLLGWFKRKGV